MSMFACIAARKAGFWSVQRLDRCDRHQILGGVGELPVKCDKWAVLGTGDVAVQPRPGSVPVVLPGRWQSLPLTGPMRRGPPCPVARAPRAGCCPAGSAGCLPPPRVRGGRIKVIVAWRRARRLGRLCRRHRPSPGDAGQMPRCPSLAPSYIRRWCAHRVPVDARDRVRAGCDTWPGT